jgi:hypothetical protein
MSNRIKQSVAAAAVAGVMATGLSVPFASTAGANQVGDPVVIPIGCISALSDMLDAINMMGYINDKADEVGAGASSGIKNRLDRAANSAMNDYERALSAWDQNGCLGPVPPLPPYDPPWEVDL